MSRPERIHGDDADAVGSPIPVGRRHDHAKALWRAVLFAVHLGGETVERLGGRINLALAEFDLERASRAGVARHHGVHFEARVVPEVPHGHGVRLREHPEVAENE